MGFCSLDGYSNRTTCEAAGGTWTDSPPSYEYGYYIKGNQIAIVEKETAFDNDPNSKDFGPGSDKYRWQSPLNSVTDGLEIQYVYSPEYFINETNDTNTALDTYKSTNGYLVLEDAGSDDFSASPESLSDGSYIVLRNAGRWNGLHKVSAAGAGSITTYTKYSGSTSSTAFEETVTLYYDVDVLNDEDDVLDLPSYLAKALVYYLKARMQEDQMNIEGKEYFMREFRRMVEKYNNTRIAGVRMSIPGFHAIR